MAQASEVTWYTIGHTLVQEFTLGSSEVNFKVLKGITYCTPLRITAGISLRLFRDKAYGIESNWSQCRRIISQKSANSRIIPKFNPIFFQSLKSDYSRFLLFHSYISLNIHKVGSFLSKNSVYVENKKLRYN